ncbi:conserved hypothetical protein [uncultured Defluviicoccus sp.]|uniref:HNH endonuclease n=1 Tax=metagenome TaxID=256318 RepID=A0A380TDV2_9ZZZZ|nr:conserved hypothetical protein [uncultured Defluviicoccus sp.]
MAKSPVVCYLCGKPQAAPTNADHVPPRQLYAKEVRKKHSPNLLTIKVDKDCNSSYQHDEDYFANTLAPFGKDSYAGDALLREVFARFQAAENRPLVGKVLREFEHAPNGILLPQGLVAKRIEGQRVNRVAWKIVRGLYFHRFGELLPEFTPNSLQIAPPDRPPPLEFLQTLHDLPSLGQYPGVFDYKCVHFSELDDFNYWGLLLWDRLILIVAFHSPTCSCERCTDLRAQNAANA